MAINTSNNKVRIISTTVSGLSANSKFSDIKSPALVVNTSEGGVFYADGSGGTSLTQLAALPNHSHDNYATKTWVGDNYLSKSGGTVSGSFRTFEVKRTDEIGSFVAFSNNNGYMGSLGFRDTDKPGFFDSAGSAYFLIHSGNYTKYFTKANIKSTLGISDWALAVTKPSYTADEVGAVVYSEDIAIYNHSSYHHIGYGYRSGGWVSDGPAMAFGANANYYHQLQFSNDLLSAIYHRTIAAGVQGEWAKVIDSNNYSDYALPLTGGTVNGNVTLNRLYTTEGVVLTNTGNSYSGLIPNSRVTSGGQDKDFWLYNSDGAINHYATSYAFNHGDALFQGSITTVGNIYLGDDSESMLVMNRDYYNRFVAAKAGGRFAWRVNGQIDDVLVLDESGYLRSPRGFVGNLTGNVIGNADSATTMSSFAVASPTDTRRYVWMSYDDNSGKPAYTDKLMFQTSTNKLFVNDKAVSLEGHTHSDYVTIDTLNSFEKIYTFNTHNTYQKLGTINLPQSGNSIKIQLIAGHGYNASSDQEIYQTIILRSGNGNANSKGEYAAGYNYVYSGNNYYNIYIKQLSSNKFEIWAGLIYYSGNSMIKVSCSRYVSFEYSSTTSSTVPDYTFVLPVKILSYSGHTHNYLPLAGGSLSGGITITSGSDFTLQAHPSGGNDPGDLVFANSSGTELARIYYLDSKLLMRYGSSTGSYEILTTNTGATKEHTHSNYAPASHTHNWSDINDVMRAGNEFNIVPNNYNNSFWFNYRSNAYTNVAVGSYHFGNGSGGLAPCYASNFITNSDKRLKTNINEISSDKLSNSLNLNFVEFDYKDNDNHSAGHIAQEVKEVLPEFVHGNESETEHLSIDYTGLHSVQIKALLDRIIKLEEEIKILKSSK